MHSVICNPDINGIRFNNIKWVMIKQYSKLCDVWELGKLREKRNKTKERHTPKYL